MSVGTRLRYSVTDGPELRCAHCGEWWAITPEFWPVRNWSQCRACIRERNRLYQEIRRRDPAFREAEGRRAKRYRLWVSRTHPQYLSAYDRERLEREREYARRHPKAAA
jgi:hypothetical protein